MARASLALGFVWAAATLGSVACGDDECKSNNDCPTGRICRLGLCALDPNQGDGTTDTSLPDIPLNCDPATAADLVLNEILADPPAGADVDGNGAASTTEDEFVEVVNVSSRAVAMTNVTIVIGDKSVQLGQTCLPSNQAKVLFGSGGLPSLTNSGSTVKLLVDGLEAQSVTYGNEGGDDQSLTLRPQLDKASGVWVKSGDTWGPPYTPGVCSDQQQFPSCGNDPVVEQDVETVDGEVVVAQCSTLPGADDLIINEVMADPGPAVGGNDSNGDGLVDGEDDEYVEIVNVGDDTLLLAGLKLRDGGGDEYTFPATACLAPNQAVVVFGKYEGTGSFSGVLALGGLGFAVNNSNETLALVGSDGTTLSTVALGSLGGDDQAVTRATDLDVAAAFVNHSVAPNAGGRKLSPGFCQTGAAFPDCGAVVVEGSDVVESPAETVDDATSETSDAATETTEEIGPTCGPAATAADLVINEALMDPPAGFDGNGDGTASTTQDEFVEIVNVGTGAVLLDGLEIWDSAAKKYGIPAGVCLEVHEALVVFGKGAARFTAAGKVDVDTTSHLLDLNNDGDTVQVKKTTGGEVVLTQAFTAASDQSWTRKPDATGAFAQHKSDGNTLAATPGACIDGAALPACLTPPLP